jgi:hypothetical protein
VRDQRLFDSLCATPASTHRRAEIASFAELDAEPAYQSDEWQRDFCKYFMMVMAAGIQTRGSPICAASWLLCEDAALLTCFLTYKL